MEITSFIYILHVVSIFITNQFYYLCLLVDFLAFLYVFLTSRFICAVKIFQLGKNDVYTVCVPAA